MKNVKVVFIGLTLFFTFLCGNFDGTNFNLKSGKISAETSMSTDSTSTQSEPLIPVPQIGNPADGLTYSAAGYGSMPCIGNPKIIVFLILFPGESITDFTYSLADVEDFFFGESGKSNPTHQLDSMRSYYWRSSYGKLDVTGTVIPYTTKYAYGADEYKNGSGVIDDRNYLFREVLEYADYSAIDDWNLYDMNNDGYIDGLVFATMRSTAHSGGYSSNSLNFTLGNGKKTFPYIYTPGLGSRTRIQSVCTIAHEIFHHFGLSDFYAQMGVNRAGTGASSIMCPPGIVHGDTELARTLLGDIPGITKYIYGWINPQHIASGGETQVTLSSFSDTPSMAVIHANGDIGDMNWFIVEYITKSNNNINTQHLESGGGLRIWLVKMKDGIGNVFDPDRTYRALLGRPYDLIETIRPNSTSQHDYDYDYFYYPGDSLTPYSAPTNSFYPQTAVPENTGHPPGSVVLGGWTDSGIRIENIEISGGIASFTINENTKLVRPSLLQTTLTYNGSEQNVTLSASNPGYHLGGDVTRTNAGYYTATVTLNEGYKWDSGTPYEVLNLHWSIEGTDEKKDNEIPEKNDALYYYIAGGIAGVITLAALLSVFALKRKPK